MGKTGTKHSQVFSKNLALTIAMLIHVFLYTVTPFKPTIIVFWVDDRIIGSSDESHIERIKQLVNNRFKMDDRGELRWFLGSDFQTREWML